MFDMTAFEWVYARLFQPAEGSSDIGTTIDTDGRCGGECMLMFCTSMSAAVEAASDRGRRYGAYDGRVSSERVGRMRKVALVVVVLVTCMAVTSAGVVWLNQGRGHCRNRNKDKFEIRERNQVSP